MIQCARLGGELVTRVHSTRLEGEGLGRDKSGSAQSRNCDQEHLEKV